jgi:hypothetical protein
MPSTGGDEDRPPRSTERVWRAMGGSEWSVSRGLGGAADEAVLDMNQAVTTSGEVFIVRDDDERAAVRARETEEEIDDRIARVRVEIPGGFVGKEDAGTVDEGTRDGNPLLFAPAQFRREVVEALAEADTFEQFLRGRRGVTPADPRREGDVFERGQFRKQEIGLKDKSHAPIAKARKAVRVERVEGVLLETDGAGDRAFETGEGVQQGGLASSGCAAKEDRLALADVEVDTAQNLDEAGSDSK